VGQQKIASAAHHQNTIFPCLMESPPEDYPGHPLTSPRAITAHFPRVGRQVGTPSARFTCENHSREGRGEGGVICKTVPFDNGSSDQLQTKNQDSQYHSASLLFKQDLSNSYWWFMASFIYIVEGGYKREPKPVDSP
jgi:hypothetical protein